MYLTYTEYQEMGGTLEEAAFNDFELESESIINWYTFNRLTNDTEYSLGVKKCVYELIDIIKQKSDILNLSTGNNTSNSSTAISSQSNDGVSVSYNVLNAASVLENLGTKIKTTVNMGLLYEVNQIGRVLLYRGLYPGE